MKAFSIKITSIRHVLFALAPKRNWTNCQITKIVYKLIRKNKWKTSVEETDKNKQRGNEWSKAMLSSFRSNVAFHVMSAFWSRKSPIHKMKQAFSLLVHPTHQSARSLADKAQISQSGKAKEPLLTQRCWSLS